MDKDHDLIVSAQMLTIIDKHERDTMFGKAGLPVAIKIHLKSHGWMDKREVSKLQEEIDQLRRELEEEKKKTLVWTKEHDKLIAALATQRKRADELEMLLGTYKKEALH